MSPQNKETVHERQAAFRGRDFVSVMAERGWDHFHAVSRIPKLVPIAFGTTPAMCVCGAGNVKS
jgi:hypothetical protein